ncbi:MAG TPA: hypothetical protein PLY40_03780, partial [Bacillota bacterium]|nr:hypothetical protein [Bacillota bacterium]
MEDKIQSGRVIKTFYSKRNTVQLLQCRNTPGAEYIILKKHRTIQGAVAEYNTLMRLSRAGLAVPAPLGREGKNLYLQYLEGELLVDILEHNLVPRPAWTRALARWYYMLHGKTASGDGTVMLKADNNLRNFLFTGGVVYGLDFEETGCGDPAKDLGQLCAYILANRPAFTAERLAEASAVIHQYRLFNLEVPLKRIENELI